MQMPKLIKRIRPRKKLQVIVQSTTRLQNFRKMYCLYICIFVLTIASLINMHEAFLFSWYNTVATAIYETRCKYFECCKKDWIDADFIQLERSLITKVYGQQIVNEVAIKALKGHLRSFSPSSKALTLSFHGRPGVGKNYVSQFIQNNLFRRGSRSSFAHFFAGRIHFPMESRADIYKMHLQDWIRGNVSRCAYSLFVFDEVDKMPAGVLDAVKPFIDHHEHIDGVDYRKCIFVFLSNTGGDLIAEHLLTLWQSGKKREDLRLGDFEDLIRLGAFNERGGFHKSDMIESGLIDHYIPFLPLEEKHVRLCVRDEFQKRGTHYPTEKMVDEVLRDFKFGPEEMAIFSNGGCKRIAQKVVTVLEKIHFEL